MIGPITLVKVTYATDVHSVLTRLAPATTSTFPHGLVESRIGGGRAR